MKIMSKIGVIFLGVGLTLSLLLSVTAFDAQAAYAPDMIAVHRFYNLKTGTHFYTASENEASNVKRTMAAAFRYENISFHAYSTPGTGRTPVHRFYNFHTGTHFYTANQAEASNVNDKMAHTYRYEGISYYADVTLRQGLTGVHRFYNFKNGTHFYTASQHEATIVNNTMAHTYRYEGVAYGATPAVYFRVCADANAAGYYAMLRGQPGYAAHLDRDNDGIACDVEG